MIDTRKDLDIESEDVEDTSAKKELTILSIGLRSSPILNTLIEVQPIEDKSLNYKEDLYKTPP
jgi:hypothetical protein